MTVRVPEAFLKRASAGMQRLAIQADKVYFRKPEFSLASTRHRAAFNPLQFVVALASFQRIVPLLESPLFIVVLNETDGEDKTIITMLRYGFRIVGNHLMASGVGCVRLEVPWN